MLVETQAGPQGVMHRDGWLFPGQHAMKPISMRQLYRIVVEATQAADIAKRIGPHTLRHSFATHLLEDEESGLTHRKLPSKPELVAVVIGPV